jgi:hypothetical protein
MKRIIKRLTLLVALFALICASCLFYAQLLLVSRAYVVTATLDRKPIQADLLCPPAIPGTFYIRLPEAHREQYNWFGGRIFARICVQPDRDLHGLAWPSLHSHGSGQGRAPHRW